MDVLAATDFFTVEVLSWRGLVTYYVLFFVELESRRVWLGGITQHPDACWMQQVARNATMEDSGPLNGRRYLRHDRDRKFCREFRETLAAGGVQCTPIPARSPNLNAHAERWVRSIKEECLWRVSRVIGALRYCGDVRNYPRRSAERQRNTLGGLQFMASGRRQTVHS